MAAVGQDGEELTEVASDNEAIENIVVASQKSRGELRRDLWRSEDSFYSLYNKLNDDNLYDVHCSYQATTGSQIKNQVCRPEFLSKAIKRGAITRGKNLDTIPGIADKMAKLRENMDMLIAANPELQAAAVTYNTARAGFMAQSETRANN